MSDRIIPQSREEFDFDKEALMFFSMLRNEYKEKALFQLASYPQWVLNKYQELEKAYITLEENNERIKELENELKKLNDEEKAKIILQGMDEVMIIDWNLEKFYLQAIKNGLKEIKQKESSAPTPDSKQK